MFSNANNLFRQVILGVIGFSSGGVIAAGIFAFLAIIGVFPRMINRTKTSRSIWLYETMIILGGVLGNVMDIYEMPLHFGGNLVLGVFGFCVGVFVGCLVMSLAETLKALPVMNRRIHLSVGFQYVILSMAVGKMIGSLIYFAKGLSAPG
ncbi:MAG: stage V sporulation protein AB [Brotaphodocola sp.]